MILNFRVSRRWRWLTFLLFTVAALFVWRVVKLETPRSTLQVAFLDVGQGDAIYVRAPSGRQMLIDGGPDRSVLKRLGEVMPFYDRSIDLVVATHADTDHITGLVDVIDRFSVSGVIESDSRSTSFSFLALENIVNKKDLTRIKARRGLVVSLDPLTKALVLFPDRDVSSLSANDTSVILKLFFGGTNFLFTGDAPQSIERYLTGLDGDALRATVLKVGHHGSRTSSEASFLAAVAPKFAVVSAAARNRYGHPHEEVINRLLDLDSIIFETGKNGTILFETNGQDIIAKKRTMFGWRRIDSSTLSSRQ
jgi:competence protein ComEC